MQEHDPVLKRLEEIDQEWRKFINELEFEPLAKFLETKLFEPKTVDDLSKSKGD